jgi:hypothetical protein
METTQETNQDSEVGFACAGETKPPETVLDFCLKYTLQIGISFIIFSILIAILGEKAQHWGLIVQIPAQFCSMVGVAFLGLGLVSAFKNNDAWCTYFETRLKKIIIGRSYIDQLSEDELLEIQKKFYARVSGRADVDEKGGLLEYFNSSFTHLMAEPYRENAKNDEKVLFIMADGMSLILSKMEYICRKGKKSIQDVVGHAFDGERTGAVLALRITLTLPHG